jgi:hypothetical protein
VDLVDEHDDVVGGGELGDDPLEALLELSAVLRSRDDERESSAKIRLLRSDGGRRRRRSASRVLDDRRLADPRLAQEHGLFFGAARGLDDALELSSRPMRGSKTRRLCHLGVDRAPNSLRNGVSFFFFGGPGACRC